MAYLKKTESGKWLVQINMSGFPRINKTFSMKRDASKWARAVEYAFERVKAQDYYDQVVKHFADVKYNEKRSN